MAHLCEGLRHYIHDRKTNNPGWKDIIVILSDPQAPGEVSMPLCRLNQWLFI